MRKPTDVAQTGKCGRGFEREFFGVDAENAPDFEYATLREGFQHAAEVQSKYPWNPSEPSTVLSKKLFRAVRKLLDSKDRGELQLYCCLATVLDQYHGTDGFFKIRDYVVLIDLTVNRNKVQQEAVLVRRQDLGDTQKANAVAQQIVDLFHRKMNRGVG